MMSKYSIKKLIKEDGVTLIELLAGIAILSIVVTAFLAFFIQAANTNKMTNEVNEATFLAQEEMEFITHYSTGDYSGEEVIDIFVSVDGEYVRETSENGYKIVTKLSPPDEDLSLYKIVVKVNKEGGNDRAQMETRLPFEKETE